MLFKLGHGQNIRIYPRSRSLRAADDTATDSVPIDTVCAEASDEADAHGMMPAYPLPNPDPQPSPGLEPREVFRFYFRNAPEVAADPEIEGKILALADAMAEASLTEADPAGESSIPAVFTYFGQFIDHDITANTDRDEPGFDIDRADIALQPRDLVEKEKLNLRNGRLNLDSLYGDGPGQSPTAAKMEAAMRDPADPAKMRLGQVQPVSNGSPGFIRPDLPADNLADIPRIGAAIDDGSLTLEEARALIGEPDDAKLRLAALIGDGRNDENLIVAQLHHSFLRLHNALVDKLRAQGAATGDDALFALARQHTTWIYQWMVVNLFLKTVCDPSVVEDVLEKRAPLYRAFFEAHKASVPEGALPMPLEFSVAAFRYGHSMVRGDYDYNRSFGMAVDGTPQTRASFDQLFAFTSGGNMSGFGLTSLPDNWIIEWDRFIRADGPAGRTARKIDSRLALPLKEMRNPAPGASGIMRHLAARNLRRGYVFNLPDAQAILSELAYQGTRIEPLTADEIASGATGTAIRDGGFDRSTPLWFYVLKEAEVRADGNHLGPLGSRLVAETLIGLLVTDPSSYLQQGAFGSWTPAEATQPKGEPITSFAAMLVACDLLAPVPAAPAAPQPAATV